MSLAPATGPRFGRTIPLGAHVVFGLATATAFRALH